MGVGNYGVGALRRLGQDSLSPTDIATISAADPGALSPGGDTNWAGIATAIQAGTTGTANIISAQRASPYNLFPTTSLSQPGRAPVYPYGTVPGSPYGLSPGASIFANINPTTLLLLGLGAVAVIALAGRR